MDKEILAIKRFLSEYDGPEMNIMEICGSHTGAIAKNGIAGMLSKKIRLISGPGCPVCVTPSSYVDRLIELSLEPDTEVLTFGDMLRVPGSRGSLREAEGRGAEVRMVYSPFDVLEHAKKKPGKRFIIAAIGFETTSPVYALLIDTLLKENIKNVKLLTSLKTMPEIVDELCSSGAPIDAFIAPGHVCVVTGSRVFEEAAVKYALPFVVSGFEGADLLKTICLLVKHRGEGVVINNYPSVVTYEGNTTAKGLLEKYFEKEDAVWRGIGRVKDSGLFLKKEYAVFDAGSRDIVKDEKKNKGCSCDKVIMGKLTPRECPLFGKLCTPEDPQGACMVSPEGSCNTEYTYR